MSQSRQTPGKRPNPRVYRRRRIVAVVLAVVAIVVVVLIVVSVVRAVGGNESSSSVAGTTAASSQAGRTPSPTPTSTGSATSSGSATTGPSSSAGASPSKSSSAAAAPACDPDKLTLRASTDEHDYADGKKPVFTLHVTNDSHSPCQMNVGTSQMEFLVFRGDDRVFSSRDCQENPADMSKKLEPGKPQEAHFTWDRNHTVPGCEKVDANVAPGPDATFDLQVKLGELTSDKVDFALTS